MKCLLIAIVAMTIALAGCSNGSSPTAPGEPGTVRRDIDSAKRVASAQSTFTHDGEAVAYAK